MPEVRILCRVITFDPNTNSILLVRNRGQDWWCAPGGGWDHEDESLKACAQREVFEETGIAVEVTKFLYIQTLSIVQAGDTWLEHFWLAKPTSNTELSLEHIDQFGVVDEARWFDRFSILSVTVYPEILKGTFWEDVVQVAQTADRYIGNFKV